MDRGGTFLGSVVLTPGAVGRGLQGLVQGWGWGLLGWGVVVCWVGQRGRAGVRVSRAGLFWVSLGLA